MTRALPLALATSACFVLLNCGSDSSQGAFRIDESMLHPDGIHGAEKWSGIIVIGERRVEPATVEVTSKGNGGLSICGQLFKVFDDHNDLDLFDPHCLHITFVDLDDDGYRDLVLLGEIIESDDEDVFIRRIPILQVYRYDVDLERFELMPALKADAVRAPSMLHE